MPEAAASVPPSWREDLQAAAPWADTADARWLRNLNESHPWRVRVGDIRLGDGRRVVLKYPADAARMTREWAAARLLSHPDAPPVAPILLGADEARRVLLFEHVTGRPLSVVLDGDGAMTAWREAARAIARLHLWAEGVASEWLPADAAASASERLPVYDIPADELVAPFVRSGGDRGGISAAVAAARQAYVEPGTWLGFAHGDLQTRHIFCTDAGPRLIDWEHAGQRHRLYDLACLIAKPINHGRRLPLEAEAIAIAEYARVGSLDPVLLNRALAPVLAYEYLIGVAELDRGEMGPAEARACLEGLIRLGGRDARLTPVSDAAALLLDRLPGENLPFYSGLCTRPLRPGSSP